MTDHGSATKPFHRTLPFKAGCVVDVGIVNHGHGPRVSLNAGATMTSQEALQLAHALVEARSEIVKLGPGG